MIHLLHTLSRVSAKIEEFIVGFSILLIMLNSTAHAMGRYFFGKSLFFAEELNQFLIVSVTFIGFAYAVRKGRNIRMTAVYDALGHKARKAITLLIGASTSALMFYLAYKAYFYVVELKDINRLSPALEFPVYLVYAIIPVGFVLAGVQYLIGFVMNLLHREIYLSYEVVEGSAPIAGEAL